jgi:hypothetical protein
MFHFNEHTQRADDGGVRLEIISGLGRVGVTAHLATSTST